MRFKFILLFFFLGGGFTKQLKLFPEYDSETILDLIVPLKQSASSKI